MRAGPSAEMESTPTMSETMLPGCNQTDRKCRRCDLMPMLPELEELDDICALRQEEHTVAFYPPCCCWGGPHITPDEDGEEAFRCSVLACLGWDTWTGKLTLDREKINWESRVVLMGHMLQDPQATRSWVDIHVERKKPC